MPLPCISAQLMTASNNNTSVLFGKGSKSQSKAQEKGVCTLY